MQHLHDGAEVRLWSCAYGMNVRIQQDGSVDGKGWSAKYGVCACICICVPGNHSLTYFARMLIVCVYLCLYIRVCVWPCLHASVCACV